MSGREWGCDRSAIDLGDIPYANTPDPTSINVIASIDNLDVVKLFAEIYYI